MTASGSMPPAPNDYSRRAGLCVEVLGWLTLLRLDLLGLVLIKAGRGVRARDRKWWKVAVALWALHLLIWLVIGAWVITVGARVTLFGKSWGIVVDPWMLIVFGLVGMALAVPFLWLIAPATRRAMLNRGWQYCINCGYDLRRSKERCPECAHPIPPNPAAARAEAAARLAASVPALPEMPFLTYSAANPEGGSYEETSIRGGDDGADGDRNACPGTGTV